MKFLHSLRDRWPFIALSAVTMVIVLWAGVMLRAVFDTKTVPPPNGSQPPTLSATPLPSWVKQPIPIPSASAPGPGLTPPLVQSPPAVVPSSVPKVTPPPNISSNPNPLRQARYGHLPYPEALPDRLVQIGTYGEGRDQRTEFLDKDAADAFLTMVADAKSNGVQLIPISGFRSIAAQEKLFERQIRRQGSIEAAARLSAPPGYSEHHSGYALDVGDGTQPKTDLKYEFDRTDAYRWMQVHAAKYGFELSFPPNNAQGVNFEPWHWRYVKSSHATATFAVAHTLQGRPAGSSTDNF